MYAICRSEKHSGSGSLGAASQHATRERETPNADPSRRHLNRVVFGAGDPAAEIERRISELQARGVKIRKNGVRAIELVLSASPEFFSKYPERKEAFYSQSVDWLKSYFGEENLASVIAHEDESTPHLSVFVLPLDESPRKKGPQIRLNAARWMDGRERLAKMQTSFAQAMAPLGLDRGVERSRARHQDVGRWYGVIERAKALTGIDNDLEALKRIKENKEKELEHLRQSVQQINKAIDDIRKDRNKRVEYNKKVNEEMRMEFNNKNIKEDETIKGRVGALFKVRDTYCITLLTSSGERYVGCADPTVYDKIKGKDVSVSENNGRISIHLSTLSQVIGQHPVKNVTPKKDKGMSL